MKKLSSKPSKLKSPGPLTSSRGEKIAAVEGLSLTPRMKAALTMTAGKSGDERRAVVKAQFAKKRS